ncbi:hypothetical protein G5B30_01225 [Sphingobacterium sp. SGG-5]|uniref:hypothetical protein n=1 Tax=Sphingobacterium sp. SGG-5 TaxID=2710881 RepID=UPI0013EC2C2A|nr:hypothetical protein [Sphingobacterium sp. SGG-5]NGM60525.1 hypothetical protein [Sphingobacterium sp. SGG-5]
MDFRMEVWEYYRKSLWRDGRTIIPLMFTDDANTDRERNWQLKHLTAFGAKKGQFPAGYNHNYNLRLLGPWREFHQKAAAASKTLFARGEFDNILLGQPWVKKNPSLVFYWGAIASLFYDIDYWNPQVNIIKQSKPFLEGLEFYNRHVSSLHNPSKAEYAFCAMHRMMDASDTETFPERIYGKATRLNMARYHKIIAEFASKGAKIGDEIKLWAGPIVCRKRKDDNDIGWMVDRGNFFKHLEQIDPETTSDAYWNVDTTIYGRFARAFKPATDSKMYFSLDKNFFNNAQQQKISLSITYKDTGTGSWELLYYNGQKMISAAKIKNTATDKWVKNVFTINDAVFAKALEKQSDFIIRYIGGDNTFFHLLDLKRE